MSHPRVKYQTILLTVTALNAELPIEAETDKLYNTVTGIDVTLTDEGARFSTLQLDINNREVLPDNFQVLRIRFKESAPSGYDYHKVCEPAGGSKVKGTYKDKVGAGAYPYVATITLRLENTESTDAGKVS